MHSVRSSQLPVARAVGITVLWVPVRAFTSQAKPTHQRHRMHARRPLYGTVLRSIGMSNGCRPRRLAAGQENLVFAVRRQRRHRQRLAARALERVAAIVARDAHFPLGLLVVRLQVRRSEIGQSSSVLPSTAPYVERMRKSFSMIAPRHRAVAEGAAAHAGRVVAVAAVAGSDDRSRGPARPPRRADCAPRPGQIARPAPACADCTDRPCGNRRPNTTCRAPAAPRSDRPRRVPWPPHRRRRPRRRSPRSRVSAPYLTRLAAT